MKRKPLLGLLMFIALATADRLPLVAENPPIDFALKDTQGREVALTGFKDKQAVVVTFIGTECPVNNLYMRRLKELSTEFAPKGVQFLAINSNSQDTMEKVAEHAKANSVTFPVLKDVDHQVAERFNAERTPEAFVLNRERRIVYRGRIDDQYGVGYQRPQPTRRDLSEALTEVLAGKPVSTPRTKVAGCLIGRDKKPVAAAGITYTNQVARILQKNCQECHRPGQIGPFALLTYKQAKGWADTIKEVVSDGRMPPWHPDPRYGKFSNDRRLSKEDRDTLLAWIDAGCPEGDPKDLPPPRQFTSADGWVIGKPDAIISMQKEFQVPAQAAKGVPYQYFVVPVPFDKDVWVQAAECRPGNRSVVHHIVVFVQKAGAKLESEEEAMENLLAVTAPGDMPLILTPGIAKRIPKGSVLLFQLHYTPNGIAQSDRSSIGLIFAKEPPKHIARTRIAMNQRFTIPPGDSNHKVVSATRFDKEVALLSFMPHMHLRGKSFEYKAVYPDGRSEMLLSVPRYDFGWQSSYRLETPLRLPAGTRIECTAHFDNSAANLNNPDPTKAVRWGDQTWEEMMAGFLEYYQMDEVATELKAAKAD